MMKYLITGAARSGTGYIAQVLRSAGVHCGHEDVFSHWGLEHIEGLAETWEADSSWLAAPFLEESFLDGTTIVHLVRRPRDTLESLTLTAIVHNRDSPYFKFARRYLPSLGQYTGRILQVVHFYVEWNKLIEPHADVFHRVEDEPGMLLQNLGIDYEGKQLFDDKKYNTHGRKGLDIDVGSLPDELRTRLLEMERRYGYEEDEDDVCQVAEANLHGSRETQGEDGLFVPRG